MRYRNHLIVGAQALLSIAILAWVASRVDLTDSIMALAAIPPAVVLAAIAIVGVGFVVAALRWGVLLRNFAVALPFWRLFSYSLMGLFFSLFLPTSIGGDAFRVFAVARVSDKTGAAVFATFQDRMLGLCASMSVGFAIMPFAAAMLPRDFLIWIAAVQCAAIVGMVFVLYPPLAFAVWTSLSRRLSAFGTLAARLRPARLQDRIERFMAGVSGLLRTRPTNILLACVFGVLPVMIAAAAYQTILSSMGVDTNPVALMLIIPMVWVVRMLPISLGGIGLGEGAFVVLAKFVGIDGDKAFATAVAILGIQIAWALLGGVLLLRSGLKQAVAYARRP